MVKLFCTQWCSLLSFHRVALPVTETGIVENILVVRYRHCYNFVTFEFKKKERRKKEILYLWENIKCLSPRQCGKHLKIFGEIIVILNLADRVRYSLREVSDEDKSIS